MAAGRYTTSSESLALLTVIGCDSHHTCGADEPNATPRMVNVSFARFTAALVIRSCFDGAAGPAYASVPANNTNTRDTASVRLSKDMSPPASAPYGASVKPPRL